VLLFAFLSIYWSCARLHKVWQTVRDERTDSPHGVDGPLVEDERSVFRGVVLDV
jgi:hypothetical protein